MLVSLVPRLPPTCAATKNTVVFFVGARGGGGRGNEARCWYQCTCTVPINLSHLHQLHIHAGVQTCHLS